MRKVKWKWDHGIFVPFCPYCKEPAYDKHQCKFCGRKYEWVEGKQQPTVVEHDGYTIIQCLNNHIQVYKNGSLAMHINCTQKMSVEQLKTIVSLHKAREDN